jgi:hypothetical protein
MKLVDTKNNFLVAEIGVNRELSLSSLKSGTKKISKIKFCTEVQFSKTKGIKKDMPILGGIGNDLYDVCI